MPPKPLRGPTRRTSVALPQTQQLNFLLEASALFSASTPQLAAVLGRKALLVGDGEQVVMPRGAAASMCGRCGLPFTADVYQSGQVVNLPRHYVRRRLQASSGGGVATGAKQVNRAAVVYRCQLCGHSRVRPFYTAAAAQQAVLKAGGNHPPLPAQQAQPLPAVGAQRPSVVASTVATTPNGSAVPGANDAARCGDASPAAPEPASAVAEPPRPLPMLAGEGLPDGTQADCPLTCTAQAQPSAAAAPVVAAPAEITRAAAAAPTETAAAAAAAPCLAAQVEAVEMEGGAQPAPAQLAECKVLGAAHSKGGDRGDAEEQVASGAAEATTCLQLVQEGIDVDLPPAQAAAPQGMDALPKQLEQPSGNGGVDRDSGPSCFAPAVEEPAAAGQPLQLLGPAAAAALEAPHEELSAQPGPAPQTTAGSADSIQAASQQQQQQAALAGNLPAGAAQQGAELNVPEVGSHGTESAAAQQEVVAAAEQHGQHKQAQPQQAAEEEFPAAAVAAASVDASLAEAGPLCIHVLASVGEAAGAEAGVAASPSTAQQQLTEAQDEGGEGGEGDEGGSLQERPRKRRRISWRQELEDVQLISPVSGARQAGEGGSAWSPAWGGGEGRRRVWFRVGRSWKTGTLSP